MLRHQSKIREEMGDFNRFIFELPFGLRSKKRINYNLDK